MFKWRFPAIKNFKNHTSITVFDLTLFITILIYSYLTFKQVSFFVIFSALINLNIWSLFSLSLGVISGMLLLMLTIYIGYVFSNNKEAINHNLLASILILTAFAISLITNLHLITLPHSILFIILASFYINLILSTTNQKPLIEIIAYLIFFPLLVLLYKGWIVLTALKKLAQQKITKIDEFTQKGIYITYAILILGIVQTALYFLSLANPLLKNYIYLPTKPFINHFLLSLSAYFSIISIIGLLSYIQKSKIFETKVDLTKLLQDIYTKIASSFVVNITQYTLIVIGFIYNLLNIITLAVYRVGRFQLDINLTSFIYRTLVINTLILALVVVYWIASLNTQKSNKLRKSILILTILTLINSIYAFVTLFLEYNITINRIILFLTTMILFYTIIQTLKNKLVSIKTFFLYLSTLLGYFTSFILIIPWWYFVFISWQFLPSHYKDFSYFYTKQMLPYTLAYNLDTKFNQVNFRKANLYVKLLVCNKDKISDNLFAPTAEPYGNYENLNFLTLINNAYKNDNLFAKKLEPKLNNYSQSHCTKLNMISKKLVKVLLLRSNICKSKNVNCALFKPKLVYIDMDNNTLYYNNDFSNNPNLYNITKGKIYEVQLKLKFNEKLNSFYFQIKPQADILPDLEKTKAD